MNKTTGLALTIGVLAIALASAGFAGTRQMSEEKKLKEELALVTERLEKIQVQPLYNQQAILEGRLNELLATSNTAKASLRFELDTIAVSRSLFELAGRCNVELSEIGLSPLITRSLEASTFNVLPLRLIAAGSISDLIIFINQLGAVFPTGMVKLVSFSNAKSRVSASIQFEIFSYQGD